MADEIIALNTRLSQRYDFSEEQSLLLKVARLAPPDADTLFERCLASQTADSFYLLSLCHLFGVGTPTDPQQEVEALRKAVDLGNLRACHRLGYHYHNGIFVPQDNEKAFDLYNRSETPHSLWNLGLHHHKTDSGMALRYYSRAYALYSPGTHREDCKRKVRNLMGEDVILQRVIQYEQQDELRQNRIAELEAQVEALRTELDYRPGGPGYHEAQQDYEARVQSLDVPSPSERGPTVWADPSPSLPLQETQPVVEMATRRSLDVLTPEKLKRLGPGPPSPDR